MNAGRLGRSGRIARGTVVIAAVGWMLASAWGAEEKFDFDLLRQRAQSLAARPAVPARSEVPPWLYDLTYDQLRRIEFNGGHSLWHGRKLPFEVQFLHPGFLHTQTVAVHELYAGRAKPVAFNRDHFNYQDLQVGEIPTTMGFAGLRLMFPFGGPSARHQELGSFVGASYFRFLHRGAAYGLSARGLALNTWSEGEEEFPRFTEFWLERPTAEARTLTLYALLESDSVAGAYRFVITPGEATVVHVTATVFARRNAKVFGVAPLTSMFWHGENSYPTTRDFRPEVHDSDGLLMHNGAGEWIYRPLVNPRGIRVTTFADENPRAFALLQRDRDFENYQDLEASYHTRPSAWVEPIGRWGKGVIRLTEVPTTGEFDDNIVAFWAPDQLPAVGQPIDFEYRLHWINDQMDQPGGVVRSTRHGKSAYYEPGLERFVIDFDGRQLQALPADARLEHVISVGVGAKLNHAALQKNPVNNTWRVAFTIRPDGSNRPIEMRCFLKQDTHALTETWSYLWQPVGPEVRSQ